MKYGGKYIGNVPPETNTSGDVTIDSSGYIQVPVGTTAERVGYDNGKIRYNEDLNRYEGASEGTYISMEGARGGDQNAIFYENDQVVTANYAITAGRNAGTFGPISIADGVTVTIPDGSVWSIV